MRYIPPEGEGGISEGEGEISEGEGRISEYPRGRGRI